MEIFPHRDTISKHITRDLKQISNFYTKNVGIPLYVLLQFKSLVAAISDVYPVLRTVHLVQQHMNKLHKYCICECTKD